MILFLYNLKQKKNWLIAEHLTQKYSYQRTNRSKQPYIVWAAHKVNFNFKSKNTEQIHILTLTEP